MEIISEVTEDIKSFLKSPHGIIILKTAALYGQKVFQIGKKKYLTSWLLEITNNEINYK